jgi:hypothetical protein
MGNNSAEDVPKVKAGVNYPIAGAPHPINKPLRLRTCEPIPPPHGATPPLGGSKSVRFAPPPIRDSQLCYLRFDGIVEEDTTMCLLDEGDHRSPLSPPVSTVLMILPKIVVDSVLHTMRVPPKSFEFLPIISYRC